MLEQDYLVIPVCYVTFYAGRYPSIALDLLDDLLGISHVQVGYDYLCAVGNWESSFTDGMST